MKKLKREIVTEVIKLVIRNIDLDAVASTSKNLFETAAAFCHNNDSHSIAVRLQTLFDLIQ